MAMRRPASRTLLTRIFEATDTLDEMRMAFAAEPARPVQLHDVLDGRLAQDVGEALGASRDWHAEYFVEELFGQIKRVDPRAFSEAQESSRLAKWEKLALDQQPDLDSLWRLFERLRSDEVVGALSTVGQPGVRPPHFKVVRYRPGDFFAPHDDGDRGIALLLYLTRPEWREGDGGTFAYEDETGCITEYAPFFNSALIFPYRAGSRHWVSPVARDAGLRYTISADYAE